ncbi:hypothetical protein D3H65_01145 [Paraflavitalea soli]|uniref:Methylamine utilisation protein MauE domain-containing protein n=1 Tax=Paraflavitalea soli TaxID=2315862 RepID=A0A3B7MH69_9BACT|nr:MauE/DoxX family redox-associated membrane protein [Paraflavitalea soli]AXY72663.1 hypothetical protein D3H65_01145 [Paraflavitalea soli]
MKKMIITDCIAWTLILFLFHIAVTKISHPAATRFEIGLTPQFAPYASSLTWILSVAEIIIALLLMFKRFRMIGFWALMFLSTLYTVLMLTITQDMPHFRGGFLHQLSFNNHLGINITIFLLSLIGALITLRLKQKQSLNSYTPIPG